MSQLLVFNHHSLPFDSKDQANLKIPDLLKICLKAQSLGLSTILVDESIEQNWFRVKLTDQYYWQDWYNQSKNDVNKDLISDFLKIQTRQPMFSSEDYAKDLDLFEVISDNCADFSSLRAAAWHESPLVSFPTRNPWYKTPIQVDVNQMEKNGEIISFKHDITNFHSINVIEEFEPEFLTKRNAALKSGKDIFNNKNVLFPFLEFCGKSVEQLKTWSNSTTILKQVKESLTVINSFCEKWRNGEFADYSHDDLRKCGLNHKVTGESETVMQTPSLLNERVFYLLNGNKEIFENHVKLAKGFRIHFFADSQSKKIHIGYIGNHLRLK